VLATSSRWLSGAVPPGSYTLVVFARRSCGTDDGGDPQSVVVV
jgi:hypothetical protein